MLQVAPSKTDTERLLLVSPELAEVLTAIIFLVRAGNAALPLVSATVSLGMPGRPALTAKTTWHLFAVAAGAPAPAFVSCVSAPQQPS